jgi:prevent-host-death family protein
MKTITVTEANQAFSRLLREMEKDGEGYVILRRGRPIARLLPERGDKMRDPEWRAAYERMMVHLRKGAHLGGLRVNRDDLYER